VWQVGNVSVPPSGQHAARFAPPGTLQPEKRGWPTQANVGRASANVPRGQRTRVCLLAVQARGVTNGACTRLRKAERACISLGTPPAMPLQSLLAGLLSMSTLDALPDE